MKLGCIGYGNMATAIISGYLKSGKITPEDIYVYDSNQEKMRFASSLKINTCSSIKQILERSEVVLLSVKPVNFTELLGEISFYKPKNTTFISIAAGISIERIQKLLGQSTPVIRAMPNTSLMVGFGTTAICNNGLVGDEIMDFVKQIFSSSGTVYELAEEEFDNVLNLNGSSPAYIYYFTKIIVDYVSQNSNIPYDTCLKMFCDMLVGSSKMMQNTDIALDELIQMVSSPNGTTVAALDAFKVEGFQQAVEKGLYACVNRAKEIGKE